MHIRESSTETENESKKKGLNINLHKRSLEVNAKLVNWTGLAHQDSGFPNCYYRVPLLSLPAVTQITEYKAKLKTSIFTYTFPSQG